MDLNKLMQQAQQMQKELEANEEELKDKTYSSTAGGGAMKITLNGNMQVESVFVDDGILDRENQGMIEEMIQTAMNDALLQATTEKEEKMAALTSGVNLPGMF